MDVIDFSSMPIKNRYFWECISKQFFLGNRITSSNTVQYFSVNVSVLRHRASERLAALWICRHVKQRGAGGPSRAVFTLITVAN